MNALSLTNFSSHLLLVFALIALLYSLPRRRKKVEAKSPAHKFKKKRKKNHVPPVGDLRLFDY